MGHQELLHNDVYTEVKMAEEVDGSHFDMNA